MNLVKTQEVLFIKEAITRLLFTQKYTIIIFTTLLYIVSVSLYLYSFYYFSDSQILSRVSVMSLMHKTDDHKGEYDEKTKNRRKEIDDDIYA